MNKAIEEMLDEYNFSGKKGVRGKYHKTFQEGYTVRVTKENETIEERHFAAIEPDVYKHFPDSKSINEALRSLIS